MTVVGLAPQEGVEVPVQEWQSGYPGPNTGAADHLS